MGKPEDEIKFYDQLCKSYHGIDDFRAKLLGFLPLATGAGISVLLDKLPNAQNLPCKTGNLYAAVGVFGALITLGLYAYEIFGITKCAALIEAGKRIEKALHIYNGQFTKRPENTAYFINEPFAAGVIYPTVLAAWIFFALAFAWPQGNPWIPIALLVILVAGTLMASWISRRGRIKQSTK